MSRVVRPRRARFVKESPARWFYRCWAWLEAGDYRVPCPRRRAKKT